MQKIRKSEVLAVGALAVYYGRKSRRVRRAVHVLRGRPIVYRMKIDGTVFPGNHSLLENVHVTGEGGRRAADEREAATREQIADALLKEGLRRSVTFAEPMTPAEVAFFVKDVKVVPDSWQGWRVNAGWRMDSPLLPIHDSDDRAA